MKLFVPGRICLFGEHSDWAGGYRRINASLEKGCALIVGTNQGIHAEVKPHPTKLILRATLNDGTRKGPYSVPMEREALLREAESGGFFSYAAGVAYQVLTHYRVRGLEIDNYLTDLPIKKGLSSSAAICVLVARAFNRVYDLKMTVRGEMEYAYVGEITTPSRCGRLDQGCAYGNRPVQMTFDGDRLDVEELSVPRSLHFVIVDLNAEKDTREILSRLNRCYPFAEDPVQEGVQQYLGPINARITNQAGEALGDRRRGTPGPADDRGPGGVRPPGSARLSRPANRAGPAQGPDLRADSTVRAGRQGRRLPGRRDRPVPGEGRGRPGQGDRDPRTRPADALHAVGGAIRATRPQGGDSRGRLRDAPVPRHQGHQEGTVSGH